MNDLLDKISGFFHNLFKENPEYGGIGLIGIGLLLLFCSIKGYEFMYGQSGDPVFNITWIRKDFGEKAAKNVNIFMSIVLILIGIGFYFAYKE